MKFVYISTVLLLSFTCIANPIMRTYPKRAPLTGKVKTVREYGLVTQNETEVRDYGKKTYGVDSYSNTGQKLSSYYIRSGTLVGKTLYAYNAKGKLAEEVYLDSGVSLRTKTIYSYDSLDNLAQETEFVFGKEYSETIYSYTAGRLTEKTYNGRYMQQKTVYKYNEKGKVIEETQIRSGSQDMTKYSYYDNGNMRSEINVYSSGDATTTYTYDEHNNEILAVEGTEGKGRKFVSEYLYDMQGNWIRCLEEVPNDWQNDKQMTIREIEYY